MIVKTIENRDIFKMHKNLWAKFHIFDVFSSRLDQIVAGCN